MSLKDDLKKEEFIQNYLQYRWLDDTRSKLVDRFFIVLIAVFAARFQFSDFFKGSNGWAIGLYLFFTFFSSFMAKSIVSFRRQQRGHGQYIKEIRSIILPNDTETNQQFGDYKKYVGGKKIYLTRWIEFIVMAIATLSPLLLLIDPIIQEQAKCMLRIITSFWFVMILVVAIIVFVDVPFCKYNFKEQLDWNKD